MPTRLIEVGSLDDTDVRLVQTTSLPPAHYIALSYCWGKVEVIKTTLGNLEAMKQSLKVLSLPKTIQDAIKVTRKLGQQYLWVDALCIIQDSVADWETESGNMASVYENAYITIAAAVSDTASEGFLNPRQLETERKAPFSVPWTTFDGQRSALAARMIPAHETHSLADADVPFPLSLRGWTLQESELASRMLIYAGEEVWWTCRDGWACECKTFDRFQKKPPLLSIKNAEDAYVAWHKTVEGFTQRDLTNPLDRLPAVSGIAKVTQDITKSRYVAGLWEKNFVSDLAWDGSPKSLVKPDPLAPTFSWASVGGLVAFPAPFVASGSCVVVEVDATLLGLNPFGRVGKGVVKLRGLVLKTTLEGTIKWKPERIVYTVPCVDVSLDVWADTTLEEFEAVDEQGNTEMSVRRSKQGLSRQPARSGVAVRLLYLGYTPGPLRPEKRHSEAASRTFLLLGRSAQDETKFERIGVARGSLLWEGDSFGSSEGFEGLDGLKGFSEEVINIV